METSNTQNLQWKAVTAYPSETLPGIGLTKFANGFTSSSASLGSIKCLFNLPLEAGAILHAVVNGDFDIGDLYCGALSSVDPIFQIASLPFQSSTPALAKQFLAAARPQYKIKFEELGLHLLYVTPWPPTGLWTRQPIPDGSSFAGLRIRTYDTMSATVMRLAGAHADHLVIGEVFKRLSDGRLDAVLSSGDGAAGHLLSEYLKCFYDIRYATPVSFTVVRSALYNRLDKQTQEQMTMAALQVERHLWGSVMERTCSNEVDMLAAEVQIFRSIGAPLEHAMFNAGQSAIRDWERTLPEQTKLILGEFFPSPNGR